MSELLKTTKKIITASSILAIMILICFYLMFVLLDILRIFFIKKKVSINSLKWNKVLLRKNYRSDGEGKTKNPKLIRKKTVGITSSDHDDSNF